MSDLISRQAAIDALIAYTKPHSSGDGRTVINILSDSAIKQVLAELPSAEPSSKRAWYQKGYRDGQKDAEPKIIRYKDCYYCISYKSFDKTYYLCDAFEAHAEGDLIGVSLQVAPDHYCSWAERREDEAD